MMSAGSGATAGAAESYYYQKDPMFKGEGGNGLWVGSGAEALGLRGQIEKDDFSTVLRGQEPGSEKQLVEIKTGTEVEDRRAGNDYTFSAPKSVSVAFAAGVEGMKEAHDRAVLAVAQHIDQHYSHARVSKEFVAGTMVAAKFDHSTSRALDPQLHSHLFVANMTQTPDGQWRANEPKNIFVDQKVLGELYRQELSNQLLQQGYQLEWTDRGQLLFEIKGVAKDVIDQFSSRRESIEQQVALWKETGEFQGQGISEPKLFEMAALNTRDVKDKDVTEEQVRAYWDEGAAAVGTSMKEIKQALEEIRLEQQAAAQQNQQPQESQQQELTGAVVTNGGSTTQQQTIPEMSSDKMTSAEVVAEAMRILVENEAVIDRAAILQSAARISGGYHDIKDLSASIDKQAVKLENNGTGREHYTTSEIREIEQQNLETLKSLPSFDSSTNKEEVSKFIAKWEAQAGFKLSDGQRDMVHAELHGTGGFLVVQGDPGSGKTTASKVVEAFNTEVLKSSGREHFTLNTGFTGRAAAEMSEASGRPSWTVDAFINAYQSGKIQIEPSAVVAAAERQDMKDAASVVAADSGGASGEKTKVVRKSNPEIVIPAGAQVVIKLDEASLVGARHEEQLLSILQDMQRQGVAAKFAKIGDTKQMQGIQAGDSYRQSQYLAKLGHGDSVDLKEINRQKDAQLLAVAKHMNPDADKTTLGTRAKEALTSLDRQGRVSQISDREELVRATVNLYMSETAKPSNKPPTKEGEKKLQSVMLVTALNKDRMELNQRIREARIEAGQIERGNVFKTHTPAQVGPTANTYQPGQLVDFHGVRGRDKQIRAWGAPLHTQGVVQSVNLEKNTVRVMYEFERNGETKRVTKEFNAAEMQGRTSTYNIEERNFSVGDRFVALKNDKANTGMLNSDAGVIKSLDEKGNVTALLDNGKEVQFNLHEYKTVDHGYATTIHKSQGATVETVVQFAYVRPGLENDQKALQQSLGTAVSGEAFRDWNTTLTSADKAWSGSAVISGDKQHKVSLSIGMIEDKGGNQLKGIIIDFPNADKIIADGQARAIMRAAGMFYDRDRESWATAITNESAAKLLRDSPLTNAKYKAETKEWFAQHQKETGKEPTKTDPAAASVDASISESFGRASYNAFNVAVTRAQYNAYIMTNSIAGLQKTVQTVDEKTTNIGRGLAGDKEPDKAESTFDDGLRPAAPKEHQPQTERSFTPEQLQAEKAWFDRIEKLEEAKQEYAAEGRALALENAQRELSQAYETLFKIEQGFLAHGEIVGQSAAVTIATLETKDGENIKGIQVQFAEAVNDDGKASLRDAGMLYDRETDSWYAAMQNERAQTLLGQTHPMANDKINTAVAALHERINEVNSLKIDIASDEKGRESRDTTADQVVQQTASAGYPASAAQQHQEANNNLQGLSESEHYGSNGYWQFQAGNIKLSAGASGLEAERRVSTDVGFGVTKTDINRDNADGSRLSSTVHRHGSALASTREERGVLTRNDGQKIEFTQEKQSFLGGFVTQNTKIEREAGEAAKISKTSTFGNSIKGTTTHIDRYGNVTETKWEGRKTRNGIEITKSSTRHYHDQKLADKHVLTTGDRAFRTAVSAIRALSNSAISIFSNDQRREAEQNAEKVWQAIKEQAQRQPDEPKQQDELSRAIANLSDSQQEAERQVSENHQRDDKQIPETSLQEDPEGPEQEAPEGPEQEAPEAPEQEAPEAPEQEAPEGPEQEAPEAPEQEAPEAPEQEAPEGPEQEAPEAPEQEAPEGPEQEAPEAPEQEAPAESQEKDAGIMQLMAAFNSSLRAVEQQHSLDQQQEGPNTSKEGPGLELGGGGGDSGDSE